MALESIRVKDKELNVDGGFQSSLFTLDSLQIPNANSTYRQSLDKGETRTGLVLSIPIFTVEETVHGNMHILDANGTPTGAKTERTEERKLTYKSTRTPKYKLSINGTDVSYVGNIPSTTNELILADKPMIGYNQDKIDFRTFFEVRNVII